jgi:putative ABC transport system permease protein
MLKNYLRVAIRSLVRQKLYAAINILGLAIGLAAAFLILLFVRYESSYDDFLKSGDRTFRVSLEETPVDGSASVHRGLISPAIGPSIAATYPQIESMARMTPIGPLLSYGEHHIVPEHSFWADPEIFDILSIDVIEGDPIAALAAPFTIALSENIARQLFGDDDPIDKSVTVNDSDLFTVVGIFKAPPGNSHIHFDAIGSISTLARWFTYRPLNEVWDSPNYVTYVRLSPGADERKLSVELSNHLASASGVNVPTQSRIRLQRVADIHLNSHLMTELEPQGNQGLVRLFLAIAAFIVLIAAINFTNLSIAASKRRDREVGVRKVAGAARGQLIGQFISEATVITFIAMVVALGLVGSALPFFNAYLNTALAIGDVGVWKVGATALISCLVVGTLAGSYPAFYLSALLPGQIFRGRGGSRRVTGIRSTLIVIQFSIAVGLMLSTLVVFRQLSYMQTQNLGFASENVLVLPPIMDIVDDFEGFRQQLLLNPEILDVTQSNPSPMGNVIPPFDGTAYHKDHREVATIYPVWIDDRYFPALDIDIVAGRNFDPERSSDAESGVILNALAVKRFGWQTPQEAIGGEVYYGGTKRTVIGVAADYHQQSLRNAIMPMGFYQDPRNFRAISVKYGTNNVSELLAFLQDKWSRYYENRPLEYEFLDDRVASAYEADRRLGSLIGAFAFLGIFVSCLGLFGVAADSVQRRRKEIGIRKVMGASTGRLLYTISAEFVRLSVIALIVGGLAGSYLINRWLENFAYHTSIGWMNVILVSSVVMLASLAAVCYESIKAALADPVESLRME